MFCDTPGAVAAEADVVITIVGFPADVDAVYFGDPNQESGILANANPGALLIDMTTSSPALARRIAASARERGLQSLDAPVSGGDLGAREARLSIMVGGKADVFERAKPLFALMGQTILHQGPDGAGQHTKMANQIAVAGNMLAVCESMAYAKAAGLNPEKACKPSPMGRRQLAAAEPGPAHVARRHDPGFTSNTSLRIWALPSTPPRKRTPGRRPCR